MYLTDAILDQWSQSATVERYAQQAWNDYDLRLDDGYPIVDRYEWNASDHPRFEAGAPGSVGGEFRPANRPGGAVSQKFIDSGMSPNATRWIQDSPQSDQQAALQQAVESASQTPVQPVVKSKRELAALPDIQKGHHLHHSSLSPELQGKLLDWNGRINQLLNPLNIAGSGIPAGETQDMVKDAAWRRLDKAPIRAMLDEMNHMDREARKFGVPLSDFVNANGIIPRELAERLSGGSRFFDPEKLRGKLKSAGDNTAQTSVRDFKEAPKHIRNEMKSNPSIREAIERAMGLKPSDGTNKPEPPMEGLVKAPEPKPIAPQAKAPEAKPVEPPKPKPVSITKHLPEANRALRALGYKPAEAGALLRKTMAAGGLFESADDLVKAALTGGTKQAMSDNLSSVGSNKLSKVIDEVVGGDDLDKKEHFKQVALDAWKEAKAVADNHNDALRQLTSFFGKHHGSMAANLSKGVDVTSIKGFDELIDHAVREYPQLISRLGSESSAGGPEDALVEALKEGIREVPQPWDDSVIDRAMEMVGPGFFEDTPAMPDAPDNPIDWEEESTPFSVRGDVLRWVQRYWCSADEMRLAAVSEWVDKYAQMMFAWDEAQHPRAPKGSTENHGGQFVKKEESKQDAKPKRQLKDGYVEQPRAKKGGEVSAVDGKFYVGGALMPVHGLFSGQEKPSPKPKKADGLPPVANEDQKDKGPRQVRERSKADIEADRERMEAQRQWDELQSGPIAELFGWIGDRPNGKAFRMAPGHKFWAPMAERLGKDGVEDLTKFMKDRAIEREKSQRTEPMYSNVKKGMIDPDEQIASYVENIDYLLANDQHFHTKKHMKAVPNSRIGEVWLGEFIADSSMKDKLDLNNKLKELLGSKPVESSHSGSWSKLPSGTWGARIQSDREPTKGEPVLLRSKDGRGTEKKVSKVIESTGGVHLVEVYSNRFEPILLPMVSKTAIAS